MRFYILSKGRPEWLKTHTSQLYPDIPVVVNSDELDFYRDSGVPNPLIPRDAANDPDRCGKACAMNWVLDNFLEPGEWAAFMDDDLYNVTRVAHPYYDMDVFPPDILGKARDVIFNTPVNREQLDEVLEDTAIHGELVGANYGGITKTNPFFRKTKWSYMGWVDGGLHVIRNIPSRRYMMVNDDEAAYLAECLAVDGIIVSNNYHARKHTPPSPVGGHGPVESRINIRRQDHALIRSRYPGLFLDQHRRKSVASVPPHMLRDYPILQLRIRTRAQLNKWRETWLKTHQSNSY